MRSRLSAAVFFLGVLISPLLNAQVAPVDTLKKVTADTLNSVPEEEGQGVEEKVSYTAEDSAVTVPAEGKAFLFGKAKVDYGSMNIQANVIEIDYNKNVIVAYGTRDSVGDLKGTPVFKDRGETMEAERIVYNLKSRKGKIYNAMTKQGELLVVGNEIKKDTDNVIYMKNMKCIPCQQADARTVFKATRAKIIPDYKIVTGPMFLEVGGVPTPLGLPFGYFPNTKTSHNGIVFPQYGSSPTMGYFLKQGGYYFPLSEKVNMIVRGDIYSNGSWALSVANNYNFLYHSVGNTYVSVSTFNLGDPDIPRKFSQQRAYEVRWQHNQDNKKNPSVRFSSNVEFVNNQQFNRFNAVNSAQFLKNTFQSRVNYTKTFKRTSLSLNATHNQNSQSHDIDISFPDLTFNINRFFPFKKETSGRQTVLDKLGISYLLIGRNTLKGKDTTLFRGNIADSLRWGFTQSVPISTNFNIFKYITATPALQFSSVHLPKRTVKEYHRVEYIGDVRRTDTIITKKVNELVNGYDMSFSTAFNTQMFFDYQFFGGPVKQIRHLMIPTISYNYRPDFGDPKYNFYKTIQRDSLGRTTRYSIFDGGLFSGPQPGKVSGISINISNNLEAKIRQKTDTGVTFKKVTLIQNLSINTFYNFAADSFKMSGINVTGRTVLFRYFDITASGNFDPYVFDKGRGKIVDKYSVAHKGSLARFVSANFAVGTSVGSNMIAAMKKTRESPNMANGAERGVNAGTDGLALQWNLAINYNLTLSDPDHTRILPSQNVSIRGDITPTKFWKIGVTTGIDFVQQNISYTSLNIYRDLKCWEATIEWVPFGARKSYNLGINLKTSMLKEFKIPRQRQWFDF
jgi:hypothetical protein